MRKAKKPLLILTNRGITFTDRYIYVRMRACTYVNTSRMQLQKINFRISRNPQKRISRNLAVRVEKFAVV